MNKKIYIVIGGSVDDHRVLGVFSSKARAKYARKMIYESNKLEYSSINDISIEIHNLNPDGVFDPEYVK